jgi:hypothetical protein
LRAILNGEKPTVESLDFPSAEEGVRGMKFIETVVSAGDTNEKWLKI